MWFFMSVLFVYLLVAIRVFIFFIGLVLSYARMRSHDKMIKFINEYVIQKGDRPIASLSKYGYIKSLIPRGIIAAFCWPIDFCVMPIVFIKAYLLGDKLAHFKLGVYYGKTSFF